MLWVIVDICVLLLLGSPMTCGYLQSSGLIFISHQTWLQAILHFYLAHYANKNFWLACYIKIRIISGQIAIWHVTLTLFREITDHNVYPGLRIIIYEIQISYQGPLMTLYRLWQDIIMPEKKHAWRETHWLPQPTKCMERGLFFLPITTVYQPSFINQAYGRKLCAWPISTQALTFINLDMRGRHDTTYSHIFLYQQIPFNKENIFVCFYGSELHSPEKNNNSVCPEYFIFSLFFWCNYFWLNSFLFVCGNLVLFVGVNIFRFSW